MAPCTCVPWFCSRPHLLLLPHEGIRTDVSSCFWSFKPMLHSNFFPFPYCCASGCSISLPLYLHSTFRPLHFYSSTEINIALYDQIMCSRFLWLMLSLCDYLYTTICIIFAIITMVCSFYSCKCTCILGIPLYFTQINMTSLTTDELLCSSISMPHANDWWRFSLLLNPSDLNIAKLPSLPGFMLQLIMHVLSIKVSTAKLSSLSVSVPPTSTSTCTKIGRKGWQSISYESTWSGRYAADRSICLVRGGEGELLCHTWTTPWTTPLLR